MYEIDPSGQQLAEQAYNVHCGGADGWTHFYRRGAEEATEATDFTARSFAEYEEGFSSADGSQLWTGLKPLQRSYSSLPSHSKAG